MTRSRRHGETADSARVEAPEPAEVRDTAQVEKAYSDLARIPKVVRFGEGGKLTRELALDCEMVGVGYKDRSALAQVCVVNSELEVVYLTYVRPKEDVVDHRTWVSGVREADLRDAPSFEEVTRTVADILRGRVLVGHGLANDLKSMLITHPAADIRDSASYPPFMSRRGGRKRPRRLQELAGEWLGMDIQSGEHNPAEDSIAPMRLYLLARKDWDRFIKKGGTPPDPPITPAALAWRRRRDEQEAERRAANIPTMSRAQKRRAEKEAFEKAEREAATRTDKPHLLRLDDSDPFDSNPTTQPRSAPKHPPPPAVAGHKRTRAAPVVARKAKLPALSHALDGGDAASSFWAGAGAS